MEANNKISSVMFRTDIQDKTIEEIFEQLFDASIADILSDYDGYDEIDEAPIEIEDKGVMIGFLAETTKEPAQIEYIDLDTLNHPDSIEYLSVKLPNSLPKQIDEFLLSYDNPRIYYSLYNTEKPEIIVFHCDNLRYELLLTDELAISRIRTCFSENESTVNMRTYYPF